MKIPVIILLLIAPSLSGSGAVHGLDPVMTSENPSPLATCTGCTNQEDAGSTSSPLGSGEEEGFEDDTPKETLHRTTLGLFLASQKLRHAYQMVFDEHHFESPTPPPRHHSFI